MVEKISVRDLVLRSLRNYSELNASGFVDGVTWTFLDVGVTVAGLFRTFRENGIERGDRIALLSENQPAWSAAYLGVVSYGAIVVPILPEFSGEDVVSILAHSEAKVIYVSRKQLDKLESQRAKGATFPEIVIIDDLIESFCDKRQDVTVDNVIAEIEAYPGPDPDDTVAVIYTSGTTGHSKGVELSHSNLTSNVESADFFAHIQRGEQMLSILPLAHTYECTLGMLIPFSRGAQVSYLSRPASPSVLMKALQTVRPHLMLAVPLLIEKIVRGRVIPQLSKGAVRVLKGTPILGKIIHKKAGVKLVEAFGGRLRFFGIGGAPLAADVERVLFDVGFPYAIGYGLTETAPLLAGTSPATNALRSTGVPTPGVEIRIQDGEIQARGPNIMKGYYRDPERTAEVFTQDGWFRTGDLGEFDEEGRLYVKGRSKTVIIGSSGENIYPEAIEAVINQFSGVEESLVVQEGSKLVARVKVDYEHMSEGAKAVAEQAVRRAGAAVGAAAEAAGHAADHAKSFLDDLRKNVNQRLSSFSRITEIREQDEPFIKTPTSKIKRYLYQHKDHGDHPHSDADGDVHAEPGQDGADGSQDRRDPTDGT